jgi:hypothetical protein
MAGAVKQVGERTFRETFGRYYEDFHVGDIYQHRPGRTITQYDNISFTLLTMNTHPMHFDEEYAKHSEFGRCIICSPLTVALMVGMSVTDVSQKAIANLGWTDIKLTPSPKVSRSANRRAGPPRGWSRSKPSALTRIVSRCASSTVPCSS